MSSNLPNVLLSPWPIAQAQLRDYINDCMQAQGFAKGVAEQYFPALAESIAYGVLMILPHMQFLDAPAMGAFLNSALLTDDLGD